MRISDWSSDVCSSDLFDTPADLLTVAISSRALFDLEVSNTLFEAQGIDAYAEHQRSREDDVLEPGIAFPLVRKLPALNDGTSEERRVGKECVSTCRYRLSPTH